MTPHFQSKRNPNGSLWQTTKTETTGGNEKARTLEQNFSRGNFRVITFFELSLSFNFSLKKSPLIICDNGLNVILVVTVSLLSIYKKLLQNQIY